VGFNSVEIAIVDAISRLPDPGDRLEAQAFLEAADRSLGADGKTSEIEARDYLERISHPFPMFPRPAVQRALDLLGSVTPSAELSANARTFQQLRSTLARVTHELEEFEITRDPGPTAAQSRKIAELEVELGRAVRAAGELAKDPQFATIAGYANAATIRATSYRAYGIFSSTAFTVPRLLEPSPEALLACTRLELAAVRDAAAHISTTAYTVNQGPPVQVKDLVDTLHGIRSNIAVLQTQPGANARVLEALNGDFNATLRLAATTTYNLRIKNAYAVGKVSDEDLPARL
jgi:hypothetical protein